MTDRKIHRTASGRVLTDEDIDAIAAQVETGVFDVEVLKSRGRGRRWVGTAPAEVGPVRSHSRSRGYCLRNALTSRPASIASCSKARSVPEPSSTHSPRFFSRTVEQRTASLRIS